MTAPQRSDVDYLVAARDNALDDATTLETEAEALEDKAHSLRQRAFTLRQAHAVVVRHLPVRVPSEEPFG